MIRVVVATVVLWGSVAWIPLPAGFLFVRLMDPRQGDRMAFANGLEMAAVASLPTLLLWLATLLVAALVTRRLPGLALTIGLLLGAGMAGVIVAGAIGASLGPYGAFIVVPGVGAAVLLVLASLIAHPVVRAMFGLSVRTSPVGGPAV